MLFKIKDLYKKKNFYTWIAICSLFGFITAFPTLIHSVTNAELGLRLFINGQELGQQEALGALNGPAQISILPELSGPDQTMLVLGENLNGIINLQGGMLENEAVTTPPSSKPAATSSLELITPRFIDRIIAPAYEQRKSLRFITPSVWDDEHSYQIIAENQSGSNPVFYLNTPVVDWVKTSTKDANSKYTENDLNTVFSPTSPEVVWSGSILEIHGKNLSPKGGNAKAWLIPCSRQASAINDSCFNEGNSFELEFDSSDSPYFTKFRIPYAVPPGVYSVWYHRGTGGIRGFNFDSALAVEVRTGETSMNWVCTKEIAQQGGDPNCLDPKNFGAVGDGVTWDTAAFISTFNAAHTNGGATIFIDQGVYRIGNTLLVPPNTKIVGAGSTGGLLNKSYSTKLLFEPDPQYIRNLFISTTTSPYWDGGKYYMSRVPTAATESLQPNQYSWINVIKSGGMIAQNDVIFEDIMLEAKRAPVIIDGQYGTHTVAANAVVTCPNPVTQATLSTCRNLRFSNTRILQNAQYDILYSPDIFSATYGLIFRGSGLAIVNSEMLGHGSDVEDGVCRRQQTQTYETTRCIGGRSYSLSGNNIHMENAYVEGQWAAMSNITRFNMINSSILGYNGSCTGSLDAFSRAYVANSIFTRCSDYHATGAEGFTFDTPYAPRWLGKPISIQNKTLTIGQMFTSVNGKAYDQGSKKWGLTCPGNTLCLQENLWADSFMVIISGKGLGQAVPIVTHTSAPFNYHVNDGVPTSDVTLAYPWTITPDETSVMTIVPRKDKTVFYKNTFSDAKNGLQFRTDVYRSVVDGNTFSRTKGTIAHAQDEYGREDDPASSTSLPTRLFAFAYLNTWLNNTYNLDYFPAANGETNLPANTEYGANYSGFAASVRNLRYVDSGSTYMVNTEPLGLGHLGNIYRNNVFAGSESSANPMNKIGIGILFNETRGGNVTSCPNVSSAQIQAKDIIVENNKISGGLPAGGSGDQRGLIEIDTSSFTAVVRKNLCLSSNPQNCADALLRDIGQGTASFGAATTTLPASVRANPNSYNCAPVGGRDLWL